MKIKTDKNYEVTKYEFNKGDVKDYSIGVLPGSDVKAIIKGYKYDEEFGMFFSKRAEIAYDITEA